MNWWNLIIPMISAVLCYVFYFIGFRRGFRAGEKQGAQTVVAHVMGLKGAEAEDTQQGYNNVRNFKRYGHDE